EVIGEPLRRDATDLERAHRTDSIARQVVKFVNKWRVSAAFFESYAYSKNQSAHTLAELGGVLRLELMRAGVRIHTANMSAARKLLLGKLPREDAKGEVFKALHAMGARFESMDESDAFVCLNWGMSELGGYCFAQRAA